MKRCPAGRRCNQARTLADLPVNARRYIEFVGEALQTPISTSRLGRHFCQSDLPHATCHLIKCSFMALLSIQATTFCFERGICEQVLETAAVCNADGNMAGWLWR
jgi:hypothetical protein